jgi:hypothetical protein
MNNEPTSKLEEYMKAREVCDWLSEAQGHLHKSIAELSQAHAMLEKALGSAIGQLYEWEKEHGVKSGDA